MVSQPAVFARQFPLQGPTHLPPGFKDESRAPQIVIGNAVCQVFGTLLFLMRAYSRLFIINAWKLEDSVLTAAWLCATAFSACQYAQVEHGAGRHLGIMLLGSPSETVEYQKWAYSAQLVVLLAFALPKYSICLAYLRIFHADKWGRRMIKGLIFVVLVPIVPFIFAIVFQCNPVDSYWTEGRPASKCYTDISGLYVNGGINVFVDIALISIVLPRVLELHLNARQKWTLIGIIALGSFAVVSGIVRMVRVGIVLEKKNYDALWDAYDISIWTATEIYVSLICAAAPGVKPLVSKILPKLLGTTLGSRSKSKTTVGHPGSIRLSSKLRRGTIGSNRVRNTHDTIFEEVDGPYTVVGRGVDVESLEGEERVNESPRGGIYKMSEVEVRAEIMR